MPAIGAETERLIQQQDGSTSSPVIIRRQPHTAGSGAPAGPNAGNNTAGSEMNKSTNKSGHGGKKQLLCNFEDLPEWMRDNPGIRTCYRVPDNYSYWACIQSIFYLHNESGNIWTHLLGALLFIGVSFYIVHNVFPNFPTTTWKDVAASFAFIFGAIICLACSTLFHSFIPHSEHVSINFNKLDYIGIVLLIVGSFCPAVFYSFYCEPLLQLIYISAISLFGVLLVYMSVSSYFRQSYFRTARTLMFVGMGVSGVFPIIHSILIHGYQSAVLAGSLNYMYTMGALYIFGAFLYGVRVPEMAYPGKFDLFFHSHQIFHVCVVAAAWVHYIGTVEAMTWRHTTNPTCAIAVI